MRRSLPLLLSLPLALVADLSADLVGASSEAHAADFTGRIRRIRIRDSAWSGGYRVVVTTEAPPGFDAEKGRLSVALEPVDGGPALVPLADTFSERIEDARFEVEVLAVPALFGAVIGLNTSKKEKDVPLEALLEGNDVNPLGPPVDVDLGDAEAPYQLRAAVQTGSDGSTTLVVSLAARDEGSVPTELEVVLRGKDPKTGEIYETPLALTRTLRRSVLKVQVVDEDVDGDGKVDPVDPSTYAYRLIGRWTFDDSAAQDTSSMIVDLDGTPSGPRVEQVVLTSNAKGNPVLRTQVSSPTDEPVVLEASVSEADGTPVIAVADEAPHWTERQFSAFDVRFEGDPTGATSLVSLVGLDAKGTVVAKTGPLKLTAEKPDPRSGEVKGTTFVDGQGQVVLVPASKDTWHLFVRSIGDAPVATWQAQLSEPFGSAKPTSSVIDLPLAEVWREYREVARKASASDALRTVLTQVSTLEGKPLADASGTEVEGEVADTGRSVEDIEAFVQGLSSGAGGTTTVRVLNASRLRR